jgi:hypothetical protein
VRSVEHATDERHVAHPVGIVRRTSGRLARWCLPIVCAVAPLCGAAHAQERRYQTNLAEEDWSFLEDRSKRADWWDPVKYIPLGRDDWFLTLSGEVRFRPEGFRIKGTDTTPSTRDQYLLQRYLFGADFHLGRRSRLYTEIQSGLISGRIGGVRPTDENTVDLHQGFYEWRSNPGSANRFDVRIGRQELTIGSSRLISASPDAERQAQLRRRAGHTRQGRLAGRGRGGGAHGASIRRVER